MLNEWWRSHPLRSLVLSPPEKEEESAALPTSASVEPTKKPSKLKKLNINPSKLPLFGVNVPPQPQPVPLPKRKQLLSDDPGLSDIIEDPNESDL